jgi:cobalt/nickel transport system permease protein
VKRISTVAFIVIGIVAAVALVLFVAPNANPNPDGLEKVAAEHGIDAGVQDHALADGPFADYGASGVENRYVGTWVAGLLGVVVTFAVGTGLVLLARRARVNGGQRSWVAGTDIS